MMYQGTRQENITPFTELMLSWNAKRPSKGQYLFSISVKTDEWSPFLLYASWGSDGQISYKQEAGGIKVYQDAVTVDSGATGYQIKIEGDAPLEGIFGIHVYTNGVAVRGANELRKVHVPIGGISQMALDHPRHKDLCSPSSTTAVVRYLTKRNVDPLHIAKSAWDSGFDIYGNWVFNVAAASAELGNGWDAWVERLDGFEEIGKQLDTGVPVIVSVKGPLVGSATPYAFGHLIAVVGFDGQKVLCMDPGFSSDLETHVSYPLADFMAAWERRGRLAYMFRKKSF